MVTPQRIHAFKELSGGLMPRRDNGTRWNSWYEMLDRAIRLKAALVQTVHNEDALAKDSLSSTDWRTLSQIRDFLQGFYDTTKATEGRQATLDQVLPSLNFIVLKFERALFTYRDHPFMKSSLHTGWTKALKYWNKTDRAPPYIAAIALNPTIKWTYFDKWEEEWRPHMKEQMRLFWETTYRSTNVTAPQPVERQLNTNNEYLQYLEDLRATPNNGADELERFLYAEPLVLPSSDTALDWWLKKEQRERLPDLSKMAINIFSIPAMSSEPERVFSGAKHTITEQRMSLKIDTIELLECLKSWFRIEVFTEEDLHEIVATEQEVVDSMD